MKIGLRIDVDTYRGTGIGVPNLCSLLADNSILATFFFSVGPDNMGRNLWRLLKPAFLRKMLRTKASGLYGWDILLRGTFMPGPVIGKKWGEVIKNAADAGHEIGFHAWDHYSWQAHIDNMPEDLIRETIQKGIDSLENITGRKILCSAAPGWRCTDDVLKVKNNFPFKYNSDCRGNKIFYPVIDRTVLDQSQIPVTLPTYDEVVGKSDITDDNYNDYIISLLHPDKLNVLTIHAEVEGIIHLKMFADFIKRTMKNGWRFVPLIELLDDTPNIETSGIVQREINGREGRICVVEDYNV